MSDLVKRLRDGIVWDHEGPCLNMTMDKMSEAADRLEALEAALRQAREACIAACEGERLSDPTDQADDTAYEMAISDCIAAIKRLPVAAINDLLKD